MVALCRVLVLGQVWVLTLVLVGDAQRTAGSTEIDAKTPMLKLWVWVGPLGMLLLPQVMGERGSVGSRERASLLVALGVAAVV